MVNKNITYYVVQGTEYIEKCIIATNSNIYISHDNDYVYLGKKDDWISKFPIKLELAKEEMIERLEEQIAFIKAIKDTDL